MKRFVALLLVAMLVLSLMACGKKESKHDAMIQDAVAKLKERWQESYDTDVRNGMETDRYLEIKNTKVVTIKSNTTTEFQTVSYLIEFELVTDYLGTAPDYKETKVLNNVLVYQSGDMEVQSNVLDNYTHMNDEADISELVKSTKDYRDAYNWAGKLE